MELSAIYLGTKLVKIDELNTDYEIWIVRTIFGDTGTISCRSANRSKNDTSMNRLIIKSELKEDYMELSQARIHYPECFI